MASDKRLDSGIDAEKEQLKDTIGSERDVDDVGILGYGVMYTVGADWNCIVPHDWLMERVNTLGIPQYLAPSKTAPHYAYDRAVKWMREDWLTTYYVEAPRMDNGIEESHEVTVDLKEGDGTRIWHVRAEVFFDEEESKQEGGTWDRHHLGRIFYDTDSSMLLYEADDGLSEDDYLWEVWDDVTSGAEGLFRRMENSHIAQDIRKMMYDTVTKYTQNVIKLRRSVYLFPAGMGKFVDSMAQLYAEVDENWKTTGEPVAVRTFEVLDTSDKQDWIQHQVEETLEQNLSGILDAAFEEFDEGEAADQVVRIIRQNLDSAGETAETYNALLEAEIDVEKALERQKQQIADADKQEIIERVKDQMDIDEFA